jgi:hypothetical protein
MSAARFPGRRYAKKRGRYDAEKPPDPASWNRLGEGERIAAVESYHQRAGIDLPEGAETLHALIHVIVENQVVLANETPVAETLARLIREGLSRHDAVHAIGSVLSELLYSSAAGERSEDEGDYFERVRELTAKSWLAELE